MDGGYGEEMRLMIYILFLCTIVFDHCILILSLHIVHENFVNKRTREKKNTEISKRVSNILKESKQHGFWNLVATLFFFSFFLG